MESENKKEEKKNYHDYKVAAFSAIISAILTGVVTMLMSSNVVYHDYLSYDSITDLLEIYFVNTKLANSDILSIESPQEQLEQLADIMKQQNDELEEKNGELLEGNESIQSLEQEFLKQNDELTDKNQKLEEEKRTLKDTITEKEKNIESLTETIKEKDKEIERLMAGLLPEIKGTQVTELSVIKDYHWYENSGECSDAYGSDYSDITNYITTYYDSYCEYKAEKKYKRIHGYVAACSTKGDVTVRIKTDDAVVWSRTIGYKEGRVEFDKNISNCEFLTLETEGYNAIFSDIYVE